jgi:NADH dehydrogenase
MQPLIDRFNASKEGGRLMTEPDMRLPGRKNVFAFGDCAAVVNGLDGKLCPPVAQFAERQGAQAAKNVVACINGQPTKPFRYRMQGQLCSIGGHSAVAEILGMRISGFLAWFLWRGIYLMKLPSLAQQIKVGIEWGCDLIFPRTLAHLRADRSRRIGRAYYASGDYVFSRGDSATEFYVIEKGEVEVLRHKDETSTDCVAVLGHGDFFGESSLLDSTSRNHSVRARTELICTVLGRNVFTQISSALLPVKEAVAKAARRRISMWQNIPDVRGFVDSVDIRSVMQPLPVEPVSVHSSVEHVISRMHETGAGSCLIVDDDQMLAGVITVSDLIRALANAALADPNVDLPVTEIMIHDPVAIAVNEPLALAISTMHDHGLKEIPVLEGSKKRVPIGILRIKTIIDLVMTQTVSARKQASSV